MKKHEIFNERNMPDEVEVLALQVSLLTPCEGCFKG